MYMESIISIKKLIIAGLVALAALVAMGIVQPLPASAQYAGQLCDGSNLKLTSDPSVSCSTGGPTGKLNNLVANIVNLITIIIGIIAVIMILIGGFKFITSNGDSNRIASARQTIIYAIVGLVIVALAQVIVRFILNKVA